MIHSLMMICFVNWMPVEEVSTANPSSLAGWIACLRKYELDHGRDAWSWTELSHARAQVLDPYFGIASLPEWAVTCWSILHQAVPLLLLLTTLAGCVLYFLYWKQKRWTSCILITVLWYLAIWSLLIIKEPAHIPMAVIHQPGLVMRQGNGLSYEVCQWNEQPVKLAEGVEARWIAERENGWVKIELEHGLIGWVPRDGIIKID